MSDRAAIAILVAIQVALMAIVDPRGNFPLNDDWAYAHSVQWLLDEHRVRLPDWIAMNLLPQTLAGGAAVALFGFSFEVLRHLTQLVALAAGIGAYAWFRAVRLTPPQALVGALATIAMPCWPVLANSFMTDLYALAFALPAALFFVRVLEAPTRAAIVAATLLAVAGTLQRQVVLVVPFAFAVAWLLQRAPLTRRRVAVGLAPFVVTLSAAFAYHAYLALGPGVPAAQVFAQDRVVPMVIDALLERDGALPWLGANALSMAGYVGLLLAGWAWWWGMAGASRRTRSMVTACGVALAIVALVTGWLPPYRENFIIDAAGIGPFTLYDGQPRGHDGLDRSPGVVWRIAGVVASFGVVALVALVVANVTHLMRTRRAVAPDRAFICTLVVAYLLPFVFTDYFDRYLLFALPFVLALWARTWPVPATGAAEDASAAAAVAGAVRTRVRHAVALCWIALLMGAGAVATHDYFAWNRARWDAIRLAERMGATPETLDGGFEYNGWWLSESGERGVPGKSWWWVRDDRFVVAFTAQPGYREVRSIDVRSWLPRSPDSVKLLQRIY